MSETRKMARGLLQVRMGFLRGFDLSSFSLFFKRAHDPAPYSFFPGFFSLSSSHKKN